MIFTVTLDIYLGSWEVEIFHCPYYILYDFYWRFFVLFFWPEGSFRGQIYALKNQNLFSIYSRASILPTKEDQHLNYQKNTYLKPWNSIWSVILASDPKNHHFSNTEAKNKFFEIFILRILKQDIFIPGMKCSQKSQTSVPMNNLVRLRSEK